MIKIKVTGYLYIEEDEADLDHPEGPLTAEAFDDYTEQFPLDDITFEVAPA